MANANESLRNIPAVDRVLDTSPLVEELASWDRGLVVDAVRRVLDAERRRVLADPGRTVDAEGLARRSLEELRGTWGDRLRRVINATGILIHTNLGRAPLAGEARDAVLSVLSGYSDLEFDLGAGRRRSRLARVTRMLASLTQAPSALAVNNNAAAVFLALRVLGSGKPVAVSRGELVEIGGSFRLPDIMEAAGATLLEIGTTNRTRPADYGKALERGAALILKVHPSNYRIEGFVEEASIAEIARLARRAGVPLVADVGSGALDQHPSSARRDEPTVQAALGDGADLVTASGDKLLGGPQAGLIFGREDLVERLRAHPLARVVRLDKTLLAALEATLALIARGAGGRERIPLQSLVARSVADLEGMGAALADRLREGLGEGWTVEVVPSEAALGGGTLPGEKLDSRALRLEHPGWTAEAMARALRRAKVPVVGRIRGDILHLDLRSLLEDDVAELPRLVAEMLKETPERES